MVQAYSDKLPGLLKKTLAQVYCIAGDDILQRDEAAQQVRSAAEKAGFSNREKHFQDKDFSWHNFIAEGQAISLFSDQKIVELHLSSSKIGTEGSAALIEYIKNLEKQQVTDTLVLITSPSIAAKPKWLTQIIDRGVYIPVYPLEGKRLESWLISRAAKKKLQLSQSVAQLLAERVEGNSIAANQELEKLALLLPENSSVLVQHIENWVADSARHSVFNMLDHSISGDIRSASRALRHLKEEGTVVPAITPALSNRLSTLLDLFESQARGNLEQGLKSERIFPKLQQHYRSAISRLTAQSLHECVQLCANADRHSKRSEDTLAWDLIEVILCKIAGLEPNHVTSFQLD